MTYNEHKRQLEEKYDLVDHPKADTLYRLAYEFGHACSWNEVDTYYQDLMELIDVPVTTTRPKLL